MKETLYSNAFSFNRFHYNGYHYTDNRHGCDRFYLAYMVKGNCKIVSCKNAISCNVGDLFFIPKNLRYQSYWYPDEAVEFISLGFFGLGTSDDLNYELQVIPGSDALKEMVTSISTESRSPSCETLAFFYSVMSEVIPLLKRSVSRDEYTVEIAEKYIRENSDCSVSDIAKACHISEPYLYVIFKRHMNITPNDLRCQILCKKGVELLQTTDKTVEEISGMLGFSSASYFRRVMKKHMGLTPRDVRKSLQF